jgi:hypothetical protein
LFLSRQSYPKNGKDSSRVSGPIREWKIPPKPNTADEIQTQTPTTKNG